MSTLSATIPAPAPAPAFGWTRNGAAQISDANLVLTQVGGGPGAGSSFYNTALATAGLKIAFTTVISGGTGGSGMALVLADPSQVAPTALGASDGGFGFTGIPGTALIISTAAGNPSGSVGNAVGVATSAVGASGAPNYVASTTAVPNLRAGAHNWLVTILNGTMTVTCDGQTVLTQAVTLPAAAMVGFTAANGTSDDAHIVRTVTINAQPAHSATPWLFNVSDYGAVGDGQIVTDGAMTTSSATLICATSAPFKASDVGKAIAVKGAGPLGVTTLVTTIASVTDAGHAVLNAAASATISSAMVLWATDDTSAIQNAINAGAAYAAAGPGLCIIYVPPGAGAFYGIAGPLVSGGASKSNGQLVMPINPTALNRIIISVEGQATGASIRHWQQTVPVTSGSCLVSFGAFASTTAQTNSFNAYGQAALIAGPTGAQGYGIGASPKNNNTSSLFSNITASLKNISLLTTHTAWGLGYGAFNFHGCGNAHLENVSIGTFGTYNGGDYGTPAAFANGNSVGGTMPAAGNNDSCIMHNVVCQGGYTRNFVVTEHCEWSGTSLYGWSGVAIPGSYGDGDSGTGSYHAVNLTQVSVEGCSYLVEIMGSGAGGIGPQIHAIIDNEGVPRFHDNNAGTGLASAVGVIRVVGGGGTISTDNPTTLQIINDLQPIGPVAPLAYTLGTPQLNSYWRPAQVTLSGGTVTAVKVSALMGGGSAPAMTTVWSGALTQPITIGIGPGAWFEIDGSAAPTAVWELLGD